MKLGSDPHMGQFFRTEVKPLRILEIETANLGHSEWNENHTSNLVAATHTLDRDASPLEGTVARNWSLRIVEQSHGKGCC